MHGRICALAGTCHSYYVHAEPESKFLGGGGGGWGACAPPPPVLHADYAGL